MFMKISLLIFLPMCQVNPIKLRLDAVFKIYADVTPCIDHEPGAQFKIVTGVLFSVSVRFGISFYIANRAQHGIQ